MGQQNAARDKEIFHEFASVVGLTVGQVDTPDPPQPDVVAMIEGVGPIAYELGEIIDQRLARNYSLSADTYVAIREYHENMPADLRVAFDQRFSGSNIAFRFSDRADSRKRRRALPAAFEWLCSAVEPEDVRPQRAGTDLADVLECVRIAANASGTGQTFKVSPAICFNPSALSILRKKLAKNYTTRYPLELILHSDRRCLYAETSWLPAVSAHVEVHLTDSAFRRIWIFERHPPRVAYVHPEPKEDDTNSIEADELPVDVNGACGYPCL